MATVLPMGSLILLRRRLLTMGPMNGPLLDQQLSIFAVCNHFISRRLLTYICLKLSVRQS